jgi:hypothetical protein
MIVGFVRADSGVVMASALCYYDRRPGKLLIEEIPDLGASRLAYGQT